MAKTSLSSLDAPRPRPTVAVTSVLAVETWPTVVDVVDSMEVDLEARAAVETLVDRTAAEVESVVAEERPRLRLNRLRLGMPLYANRDEGPMRWSQGRCPGEPLSWLMVRRAEDISACAYQPSRHGVWGLEIDFGARVSSFVDSLSLGAFYFNVVVAMVVTIVQICIARVICG